MAWLRPPILPGFTFNEGRHTHRNWLAEDGIPEAARAARLGRRMRGRGDVYEHVSPGDEGAGPTVLGERWRRSLQALRRFECRWVVGTVPRFGGCCCAPDETRASWREWEATSFGASPRSWGRKRKKAAEAASDLR
ncbi:hypothetical protein GCM10023224_02040 [Streptomonospora halophila]|uniref:Uncharacterized protein n=1 Tax=Streptomonospora halophila TaxID=427369 RepID=A0ABP9G4A6_9ACTN